MDDAVISGNKLVKDIPTTSSRYITISVFYCWIKVEERIPKGVKSDPTILVNEVDDFKGNTNPCALYWSECRLKAPWPTLLQLDTSELCPLIIKVLQVNIYIDRVLTEITLTESDTLETVIDTAAKSVDRLLQHKALNANFDDVENLDAFILETPKDRSLYFNSVEPPGPNYSHGSRSVSYLATSCNDKIKKYCIVYNLYAHWFCLEIYDQFNGKPDDEAVNFSHIFRKIMDVDHYSPPLLLISSLQWYMVLSKGDVAYDNFLVELQVSEAKPNLQAYTICRVISHHTMSFDVGGV